MPKINWYRSEIEVLNLVKQSIVTADNEFLKAFNFQLFVKPCEYDGQ